MIRNVQNTFLFSFQFSFLSPSLSLTFTNSFNFSKSVNCSPQIQYLNGKNLFTESWREREREREKYNEIFSNRKNLSWTPEKYLLPDFTSLSLSLSRFSLSSSILLSVSLSLLTPLSRSILSVGIIFLFPSFGLSLSSYCYPFKPEMMEMSSLNRFMASIVLSPSSFSPRSLTRTLSLLHPIFLLRKAEERVRVR